MASAQQLIGLVKSHAEGDADRFYDLAIQLAAAEEQKGHTRLAEQLRQWAEAGSEPNKKKIAKLTPLAAPRGELGAFLSASYPSTRISDVIVPVTVADELEHIVMETRMAERLTARGLSPRKRLLLSGPPGTGKTMTATALAGELKFPLFTVLLHGLITKYMGETAQKLRMIFDAIRTTRGVYLFDEIDALAASRGADNDIGEARRILNSFLQFLDEDAGPSIIVATTNLPELLDKAILRRFDLVLSYDLPERAAIEKAMKHRLNDFVVAGVSWDDVTSVAKGLSTADVIASAEDAARRTILSNKDEIDTDIIVASLERRCLLQGISAGDNDARSKPHFNKPKRKSAAVQSKRKRVIKIPE